MTAYPHLAVLAHPRHPVGEPFAGGMESHTWHLCQELTALGAHTVLYAPVGSDPSIASEVRTYPEITLSATAARDLARFEAEGAGHMPVCMAKTPYSFTADEHRFGAPEGFVLPVEEVRLAAGAGFVVALCGRVNTMPGLPRVPASTHIALEADGRISGLS